LARKIRRENRISGMENGDFGWVKVGNKAFRPDFGRGKNNLCGNHQENRGF
jgi:hypothetical protein